MPEALSHILERSRLVLLYLSIWASCWENFETELHLNCWLFEFFSFQLWHIDPSKPCEEDSPDLIVSRRLPTCNYALHTVFTSSSVLTLTPEFSHADSFSCYRHPTPFSKLLLTQRKISLSHCGVSFRGKILGILNAAEWKRQFRIMKDP
jgi:hypothetical protein